MTDTGLITSQWLRMIESEFCERCFRPYALSGVRFCDSCIKDLEYESRVKPTPPHNKTVEFDGKYLGLLLGMLFKPLEDMKDYRGS